MAEVEFGEEWMPPPDVIVDLYEKLATGEIMKLKWQCIGRRAPADKLSQLENKNLQSSDDGIFFDFDETPETPLQPVRTPGSAQPRGSARKKTTDLSSIISNMQRHQLMDMKDSPISVRTSAPKKEEPGTPSMSGEGQLDSSK